MRTIGMGMGAQLFSCAMLTVVFTTIITRDIVKYVRSKV